MKHPKMAQRILAAVLVCLITAVLPFTMVSSAAEKSAENRFNVVIVLDASGSMRNTDPQGYRYEAISQFTGLLAEQGNVLGGVVFHEDIAAERAPALVSGQADKDAVTGMLKSVPSDGGWTNIGAGLNRAVEMIREDGNPGLPSVIVFLSDGNTDMATADETKASLDMKAEAIQEAREQGIAIYSVCLNANRSADITEMQQLADATGGDFQNVVKAEDLQDVFNAFYNLIYGTSTISLVDEVFSASGQLETTFEVPGLGVEEVNIIIYGNPTKKTLIRPDGTSCAASSVDAETFSMLKLTDVVPGTWTLVTEGIPGDNIKINMVYNSNLGIETAIEPDERVINPVDPVTVTARLKGNNVTATSSEQCIGYSAALQVMDAYGEPVESIPMELVDSSFQVQRNFEEGTYYYKVLVTGNHIEKESEKIGPITVTSSALTEAERNNTPPTPVSDVVKDSVNIWPFKGGSYTLDMNTLASDEQDDTLRYKILSSSFIEGTDYTVNEDGILHMDQFSLSKGSFTIQATDSGGLSCQIEVILRVNDIGMMTLIGLGALALVAAAIFGVSLHIALTKPFRGDITAQSYCNGSYKGKKLRPGRGRCKLSRFGMDNVGLNYLKCYFQATGDRYVYLVTNQPVIWNGQKTKKIRIDSGAQARITIHEGDPRALTVWFESRFNNGMSRGGRASIGGYSSTQQRGRR